MPSIILDRSAELLLKDFMVLEGARVDQLFEWISQPPNSFKKKKRFYGFITFFFFHKKVFTFFCNKVFFLIFLKLFFFGLHAKRLYQNNPIEKKKRSVGKTSGTDILLLQPPDVTEAG